MKSTIPVSFASTLALEYQVAQTAVDAGVAKSVVYRVALAHGLKALAASHETYRNERGPLPGAKRKLPRKPVQEVSEAQ